ncbi:hypothetical protein HYC85_009783 [Camellia sinensis]|uniref:CBM-cenC domain-containing protein n=1 Tax=Camellia sinensis TaxID=4442 RepID=A0A7J7HGK7_CAMSI|nr:hypothetical protein HYC85_009783 [Camellia sinensis]
MKIEETIILLLLLFSPLLSGLVVDALPYDYSATLECLENPHKPQYSGGIVVNPELDDGLKGWTVFGDAKIEHRASKGGNTFVVARHRHESHDSFSQKFQLEKGMFYTFSAWLQVSLGNAKVAAMFKTPSGFEHAGWVVAKSGCWSMLKGGLVVNASGPSHLYFEIAFPYNHSPKSSGDLINIKALIRQSSSKRHALHKATKTQFPIRLCHEQEHPHQHWLPKLVQVQVQSNHIRE